MEVLEEGFEKRADGLLWLKVDPRLDGLRAESAFQSLLRRAGMTPAE
jgi:hypothetical protein